MATDTARVKLELASGKNEITAPFHNTAQRRRNKHEPDAAASVDAPAEPPAAAQVIIDVPLAEAVSLSDAPAPEPEVIAQRPGTVARTPWIAFAVALVAVAGAVWWVMFQRLPDIDPREVVERNLADAQSAMAEGRYTDPPERSALHYYSTVLALDPRNADATAGIDAIADRHITNARVLLDERRVAEAGVALEKARRVRPDHTGLPALDAQWRKELRKMLASGEPLPKPMDTPPPVKQAMVKRPAAPLAHEPTSNNSEVPLAQKPAPAFQPVAATTLPEATNELRAAVGATPAMQAAVTDLPGTGPTVEDTSSIDAAPAALPDSPPPAAVPAIAPKLIRMVQPQYPQEALMRGLEGWVDVSLQVSASGDVITPRVEDSSRGRMFNRAALSAVQQWKYEPRSDGTTSERISVRLQFRQSN